MHVGQLLAWRKLSAMLALAMTTIRVLMVEIIMMTQSRISLIHGRPGVNFIGKELNSSSLPIIRARWEVGGDGE